MGRSRTSLKRWNVSLDSRQREILGLLLLALGVLTLLSLLNVTPGTVSGWWAGFLRRLFGWGAFPVALALGAGGVILLASLALVHLLSPNLNPLQLAHDGGGGGYVGWAISSVLNQFLGLVMAFLILLATAIAGLILTFDLSLSQIQHGLTSAWKAGLAFYRHLRPPAVTKPQKPRPAPTPKTQGAIAPSRDLPSQADLEGQEADSVQGEGEKR